MMRRIVLIIALSLAAISVSLAQTRVYLPVETTRDPSGVTWQSFELDDNLVSLSMRYMRNYGRYYLVDLYVLNAGEESVSIPFEGISLKCRSGALKVFDHDRYVRRLHRKQGWRNFGTQIAIFTTTWLIDVLVTEAMDLDRDDRYSLGEAIGAELLSTAVQFAGAAGSAAVSERYIEAYRQAVTDNLGYFKTTNLLPGHAVQGHFFTKFRSTSEILLTLELGGVEYTLALNTIEIPEVER